MIPPVIDGDRVLWIDNRHNQAEFYLYDLAHGVEVRLAPGKKALRADISGDIIAYRAEQLEIGSYYPLYMYNIFTEETIQISDQRVFKFEDPKVDANRIIWKGADPDTGNAYIYMYVVQPSNEDPVAEAGNDQALECSNANETASVLLDGSVSYDPDGDLLYYVWEGPFDTINIDNPYIYADVPLGSHIVTLSVDDGNGGSDSDNVNITVQDTTSPLTTASVSGVMGNNNWFVSQAIVSLSSTDICSRVTQIEYELNGTPSSTPGNTFSLNFDDGEHTLSYWAIDDEGREEDPHVLSIKMDTMVPDIEITNIENNATYALGLVPTAGYLASDATSGLFSSSDELTGGNSIGLGRFIYTVTAVDYASNVASVTASYTVIATTQGTAALIDQFVSTGDIRDSGKLYDYMLSCTGLHRQRR